MRNRNCSITKYTGPTGLFVSMVIFTLSVKLSTVAFNVKSAFSVKSNPTGISSIKAVTFGPIIPDSCIRR